MKQFNNAMLKIVTSREAIENGNFRSIFNIYKNRKNDLIRAFKVLPLTNNNSFKNLIICEEYNFIMGSNNESIFKPKSNKFMPIKPNVDYELINEYKKNNIIDLNENEFINKNIIHSVSRSYATYFIIKNNYFYDLAKNNLLQDNFLININKENNLNNSLFNLLNNKINTDIDKKLLEKKRKDNISITQNNYNIINNQNNINTNTKQINNSNDENNNKREIIYYSTSNNEERKKKIIEKFKKIYINYQNKKRESINVEKLKNLYKAIDETKPEDINKEI